MLAHSFLMESSSKLLVTRIGIKAWMSSISGLWFPWHMFFEMRFDLGTLDSGEQLLPFGLLVFSSLADFYSQNFAPFKNLIEIFVRKESQKLFEIRPRYLVYLIGMRFILPD